MEFTEGGSAPRNNLPGKDKGGTGKGKAIGKRGFRVQDKCTLSLSPWGALGGGDLHHIRLLLPSGSHWPRTISSGEGCRCEKPAPREPEAGRTCQVEGRVARQQHLLTNTCLLDSLGG